MRSDDTDKLGKGKLFVIGAVSGVFWILPLMIFWGDLIQKFIRCDYSTIFNNTDSLLGFIFAGFLLFYPCIILGGILGIFFGKLFYSKSPKPFFLIFGALFGGLLVTLFLSLGMMLIFFKPWVFCK